MEPSVIGRLERHAYLNHVPLHVTFEITLGCNLRCVHCYNFDRSEPAPRELKSDALNPAEILRILDEVADAGALFVGFTGGEALLHPHLLRFVERARDRGCVVRIKSNGTLLTPSRVAGLVEAGASFVDISVYGAVPETHDRFTTVQGSFAKTKTGIESARDGGLRPQLSFILHRDNVHEVPAMVELAETLGVGYSFSTELTGRYDGTTSSRDLRMTREQFQTLLQGPNGASFDSYLEDGEVRCPCARSNCGISASGEVYPCIGAPIPSGNLRKKSFQEIWKNSEQLNRIRGLEVRDFKSCEPCKYRKHCSRSSGSVYVDTGDYTGAEPQACMEAEVRYRAKNENRIPV